MSTVKCKLERCPERFTPTRPGHEFHSAACRSEWHRNHTPGTGEVKRLQQLKGGHWSITIHLHEQPQLQVGAKIALSRVQTRSAESKDNL